MHSMKIISINNGIVEDYTADKVILYGNMSVAIRFFDCGEINCLRIPQPPRAICENDSSVHRGGCNAEITNLALFFIPVSAKMLYNIPHLRCEIERNLPNLALHSYGISHTHVASETVNAILTLNVQAYTIVPDTLPQYIVMVNTSFEAYKTQLLRRQQRNHKMREAVDMVVKNAMKTIEESGSTYE